MRFFSPTSNNRAHFCRALSSAQPQRQLRAIVACSSNYVIGFKGRLPWRFDCDWTHFLRTTAGGVIIVGRQSYEELNYAIPGRETIVISNSRRRFHDAVRAGSVEDALSMAEEHWPAKDVWICGGERIYQAGLPYCGELYITRIMADFEGDRYFPSSWRKDFPVLLTSHVEDERGYRLNFELYSRASPLEEP